MRLRLVAGELGGRWIDAPDGYTTHPMGERIRGALFNILGDTIVGGRVLDAFSGSGALGLEAISRGANSVVLVEKDRLAQKIITKNIKLLGISDKAKLIKSSVSAWSNTSPQEQFDLILCDPPYSDLQLSTVEKIVIHLKSDALMVLSHPGRESAPTVNGVVVVDKRNYGDAALAFYRREVDYRN